MGWNRFGMGWNRVGMGWNRFGMGWNRFGMGWSRFGMGSSRSEIGRIGVLWGRSGRDFFGYPSGGSVLAEKGPYVGSKRGGLDGHFGQKGVLKWSKRVPFYYL